MSKVHIEDVVDVFWRILWYASWAYLCFLILGGLAYRYLTGEQPPHAVIQLAICWGGIFISLVGRAATDDWTEKKRFTRLSPEAKQHRIRSSIKELEDVIDYWKE